MRYRVGILGSTGAVGQRFIQLLSSHPWFEITAISASERNVGKKYSEGAVWRLETPIPEEVTDLELVAPDPKKMDCDIVFSALPSDEAKKVEPLFAESGFVVASNASAYRMEDDIPLVIPEVNADHLGLIDIQRKKRKWDGFIVTNPNCSTIGLVITLKPLMQFGLHEVRVVTMQAVSGAGYEGVPSMAILDNIIPYIAKEEEKIETESKKLLGEFDGEKVKFAEIDILASCNRVPVIDGHLEAVFARMHENPTPEEVKKVFKDFRSIDTPSAPKHPIIVREEVDRPQTRLDRNAENGMSVTVGRVREGIRYICLSHNTIRGAAGASVLNAELMVKKGII
jgi:aspartate-semialdehyde dehydrogenase